MGLRGGACGYDNWGWVVTGTVETHECRMRERVVVAMLSNLIGRKASGLLLGGFPPWQFLYRFVADVRERVEVSGEVRAAGRRKNTYICCMSLTSSFGGSGKTFVPTVGNAEGRTPICSGDTGSTVSLQRQRDFPKTPKIDLGIRVGYDLKRGKGIELRLKIQV